jgi:hypothetical protein
MCRRAHCATLDGLATMILYDLLALQSKHEVFGSTHWEVS